MTGAIVLWFFRVIGLVLLSIPTAYVNMWWKIGAAIVIASSWHDKPPRYGS